MSENETTNAQAQDTKQDTAERDGGQRMRYGYYGTTTWIEHPGGWCEYYDRRLTLAEIKQEWERMQPVRLRFTLGEQLFGRKVPLDKKPTRRRDPARLRALAQMTAKERKEEFWGREYGA